jgi:RNA polymerase sigma factor (sigma-70 family)
VHGTDERTRQTPALPELVEAARAGDTVAFEELVRRFQGMAVGYAFAVMGDFHRAEDAAQEAFVEVHFGLGNLREVAAFASWLRRIVFKHCDRQRRRKRVKTAPLAAGAHVAEDGPGPAERIEAVELREAALQAVMSLPEHERIVTTMFYIEDRSHKEIAGFLEVPTSTVKSRLHSARGRLKEDLMTAVAGELRRHAPDDSFARRVAKAIEVYTAKGPPHDHMRSGWHEMLRRQTHEILRSGEEGFRLDVELSRSPKARVRGEAALHFGIRHDPRGKEHLLRLMRDQSAHVRARAARWYGQMLIPTEKLPNWYLAERAESVPEGAEELVPALRDEHAGVRVSAVMGLSLFVELGNEGIDRAVTGALKDPVHKVQHAAARVLRVECPGCRANPLADRDADTDARERRQQLCEAIETRMREGDDGLREDVGLSRSAKRKHRREAAIRLGLRGDPRAKEHVRRLLSDEHARVRREAIRAFASLIHPNGNRAPLLGLRQKASSVPEEIEALLFMVGDRNWKNQRVAVEALGDYAGLDDPRIERLFREILSGSDHKLSHAAARVIGVGCPACGEPSGREGENAQDQA